MKLSGTIFFFNESGMTYLSHATFTDTAGGQAKWKYCSFISFEGLKKKKCTGITAGEHVALECCFVQSYYLPSLSQ